MADFAVRWEEAVAEIVRELELSVADTGSGPGWEGPDVEGDEQNWRVVRREVGPGLYGGAGGIGLFLAAAWGRRVKDVGVEAARLAEAAASRALATGWERLEAGEVDLAEGAAGIAWAVGWTGALLNNGELMKGAERLAVEVAARLNRLPVAEDWLGGTAGALAAILAVAGDQAAVAEAATGAAVRMAQAARAEAWGLSWAASEGPGLCGLAHGASGVALALAEAGGAPLEPVVDSALAYERSWFDAERGGWPDLRRYCGDDGALAWPALWCHGALGIGLVRLRLHELRPSDVLLAEVSAAVQAARVTVATARAQLREGKTTDCTLCHGLGGAAELFLASCRLPGGADHRRAARRVGALLLAEREWAGQWPCGVRSAGESPGLFLGTTGIGLTLLRIADPTSAPACTLPQVLPHLTTGRRQTPGG